MKIKTEMAGQLEDWTIAVLKVWSANPLGEAALGWGEGGGEKGL
jgi:hypothetical protein